MCGRFMLVAKAKDLARHFGIPLEEALAYCQADEIVRQQIVPSQNILFVRQRQGNRHLAEGRWGLIPPWAKSVKDFRHTFNARWETAARLPAFRSAWRRQRCLIPASAFWEWQDVGTRKKVKYRIQSASNDLLAFAGLWENWENPDTSKPLVTTTILTTAAGEALRQIHSRVPVLLGPENWDVWLCEAELPVDWINQLDSEAGQAILRAEKDDQSTPPSSRQGLFWGAE